jgi:hypothetical protein
VCWRPCTAVKPQISMCSAKMPDEERLDDV